MKKLLCQSISVGVTMAFGRKIAARLTGGGTILLEGGLGTGKTTFVQGLAEGLGVKQQLTSPTFALMKIYPLTHSVIKHLVHLDLYRLTTTDSLSALDINHWQTDPSALLVVEWPERTANGWYHCLGNIKFTVGDNISLRQLEVSGELTDLLS